MPLSDDEIFDDNYPDYDPAILDEDEDDDWPFLEEDEDDFNAEDDDDFDGNDDDEDDGEAIP